MQWSNSKFQVVCLFWPNLWNYGDFCLFLRKRLYLSPWASNPKNKTTLFSPTFKIEGNKVVLFFGLEVQGPRYQGFERGTYCNFWGPPKNQNFNFTLEKSLLNKKDVFLHINLALKPQKCKQINFSGCFGLKTSYLRICASRCLLSKPPVTDVCMQSQNLKLKKKGVCTTSLFISHQV